MVALLPLGGALFSLAERFWLPGIVCSPTVLLIKSFACSWLYAFAWSVDVANKAVSFGILMNYWVQDMSPYLWLGIFLILPLLFNLLNVQRIGEIEFVLTSIKILTLVGLVILGLVIISGGTRETALLGTDANYYPVPCNETVIGNCLSAPGFDCTIPSKQALTSDWKESAFKGILTTGAAGKVAAFWDCFLVAVFAYVGIETLGITAWETECPRKSIPQAVRRVSNRITIYYIAAVFVIGLTVSSNDPLLLLPTAPNPQTPGRIYPGAFIIMAERAGLPVVAHIINAVMILAVLSAATADIYVTVCPPLTDEVD